MRHIRIVFLLGLGLLLPLLSAADVSAHDKLKGKTFYFGSSEPRTNISFTSDADIELIQGTTNKMDVNNSKITVDASGKQASGSLRVGVRALKTGIAKRDEHLRSAMWLDAARHPWITLKINSASENKDGKTWNFKGAITIKGVTKAVAGKARVRPIPSSIKGLGAGEWLRLRVKFDVSLSDFNIKIPSQVGAKVNNTWNVSVDIYGTTAAPKRTRR